MKKVLTLAIILLIALSTSVFAAEVSTEAQINTALAGTETTITLTGDITLTAPIEIERDVTLDLNGHVITPATGFAGGDYMIGVHRQAHLTIKDSGTNGKIANNGMELVVVKMTVSGENDATYPAKFTLESGTLENTCTAEDGFATISGNGYRHNTEIVINGGTVKATGKHAIYQPQDGKITVNGGTIEGITGIEIRSGELTVNGGTIIGTGTTVKSTANGSGTTTVGAGIAIAQHGTEKDINVVIEGGTIQGYAALYQSNPEGNQTSDNVNIEVNGGEFEAISGGTEAVYSEEKTDFITGGTFSSDVSDYVATNMDVVEDEDGNVYVGTLHTITVEKTENGKVTASEEEAVVGQTIKLTVEAAEGYELKSLTVNGTEVKDNKFVMPDADATVKAEFSEIVVEEEPKEEAKDEEPKMGTQISLFAVIAVIALAGYVVAKKK